MEGFLICVGIMIAILGICCAFCDFDGFLMGIIIAVIGCFIVQGGLSIGDLRVELHSAQQQVLSNKNLHKAEVKKLEGLLTESQEAAMELSIETQALQLEVNQCTQKQELSRDTLSGIKEILEN